MPVASLNARHQLRVVLKRFKFAELESAVLPTFPETSWSHIRSLLMKNHESFTVANAIRLIEDVIIDVPEKILKDRLSVLELIDISRHHNRKIWYGYSLIGPDHFTQMANKEIRDQIAGHFASMNVEVDVKVTTYNGIMYMSFKEKEKKRQKQRVGAIFFALFLGQKYFFCSRKNVPKDFLMAIATCMGCKGSKSLKLMGRDLKSLMKLLWMKRQGATSAEDIAKPPEYKETPPITRKSGVDFTQDTERKEYAQKCFGNDPPSIELLVVNGPEAPWTDEAVSSEVSNENISTGWEFRSRHVPVFLTKLTERRIFVTPLPHYISRIMTMGKTELTLKSNGS